MRIVAGCGKRRVEWEVSARDYREKRNTVVALFEYLGIPNFGYRQEEEK